MKSKRLSKKARAEIEKRDKRNLNEREQTSPPPGAKRRRLGPSQHRARYSSASSTEGLLPVPDPAPTLDPSSTSDPSSAMPCSSSSPDGSIQLLHDSNAFKSYLRSVF